MYAQQENQEPPLKRKRSLPGNPDPDAEVIAMSPKSLLATNRFICEICNKGFKRDQNLQLHRRGHNLPWKLKQRTNKEVKKKVYVCPETTCVHHDPSRALGDLTGIKKHFCRKHGEKKWKCEKCSKRYAVQSDWKAHSKICGTREYRCDCGTLFSRRDSFITHRAFCDALAEENVISSQLLQQQQIDLQSVKREQDQSHQFFNPRQLLASNLGHNHHPFLENGQNPSPNPNINNNFPALPPFQPVTASPHISATALLQKAAQMGVSMSKPSSSSSSSATATSMVRPHQAHMSEITTATGFSSTSVVSTTAGNNNSSVGCFSSREHIKNVSSGIINQHDHQTITNSSIVNEMMSFDRSMSDFDREAFNGMLNPKRDGYINIHNNFQENLSKSAESQFSRTDSVHGNDGLTRDFLGLKTFSHKDFLDIAGFAHLNSNSSSSYGQHSQNQSDWQG
ncbi:protein indeterminate-domain 12-like [Mercurialis annua]|uniref:protein indeterminate-domain 12-like n=1 Tax=Mercurialis annua TaxID=3986 RepID=UPI00215F8BD9|nr:protein indeterminate-domain 12-like [Mercurialis annua]